jgi:hypothetical protein
MTEDHKLNLRYRLRNMSEQPPTPPWRHVATRTVGGLIAVGYGSDTDLVLTASLDGRALFDCASGKRLAENLDCLNSDSTWYDDVQLRAIGIGALRGRHVSMAGAHGGGLRRMTRDGWFIQVAALDWPDEFVFLTPPGGSILFAEQALACRKILRTDSLVATGFSSTGMSFIVADGSELHMFSRLNKC